MRIKQIILCTSLLSLGLLFQNCGVDSNSDSSDLSSIGIQEETFYDLDNVINTFGILTFNNKSSHVLAKPYYEFQSQFLTTQKGNIIYFHCSNDTPESCIEEIKVSANRYCEELGSSEAILSEGSVDFQNNSGSLGSLMSSDDPYFTIRLKSGEHIETSYRYVACLNVDLVKYQNKIQPVK